MNDKQSCFAVKKTISRPSADDGNASYTPKSPIQLPSTNHCSTTNPNPSISTKILSTYITNGHNTSMPSVLLSKPEASVLSPISTLPVLKTLRQHAIHSFLFAFCRQKLKIDNQGFAHFTGKILLVMPASTLVLFIFMPFTTFSYTLLSTIQHKFSQTLPKPSRKSSSNPCSIRNLCWSSAQIHHPSLVQRSHTSLARNFRLSLAHSYCLHLVSSHQFNMTYNFKNYPVLSIQPLVPLLPLIPHLIHQSLP